MDFVELQINMNMNTNLYLHSLFLQACNILSSNFFSGNVVMLGAFHLFHYVILFPRWTLITDSCKSKESRGNMEWDKWIICGILWKIQAYSCTVKQPSCGRIVFWDMCSALKVKQHFGETMSPPTSESNRPRNQHESR
jgi:hypothetical protein